MTYPHTGVQLDEVMNEEAYEAYLRTLAPDEVVGHAQSHCACPLATYLMDRLDTGWVEVSSTFVHVDGQELNIPRWMIGFIQAIDIHPFMDKITARMALDMLLALRPKGDTDGLQTH